MAIEDVTNPGVVNVADQAFDGAPNPDQAVTVTVPASTGAINFDGDDQKSGGIASPDQAVKISSPASTSATTFSGGDGDERGLNSVDQPVTVQVPGAPDISFDGGLFHPGGVPVDVTQNNVAGQVYGVGVPANVFV